MAGRRGKMSQETFFYVIESLAIVIYWLVVRDSKEFYYCRTCKIEIAPHEKNQPHTRCMMNDICRNDTRK